MRNDIVHTGSCIFYVSGPDGVGKSTLTREMNLDLISQGARTKVVWFRFNHYFSLPLLFLARLMRLTDIQDLPGGSRVGYHRFRESRFFKLVYPLAVLMDTYIAVNLKVMWPMKKRYLVLCDRFIPDVFVDLALDLGDLAAVHSSVETRMKSLIPAEASGVIITEDPRMLRMRRTDVEFDRNLEQKVLMFAEVANRWGIPEIKSGDALSVRTSAVAALKGCKHG